MSKTEPTEPTEPGKIYTRAEVLQETSAFIQHLKEKAKNGRFRDPDMERLRDAKTRSLIELLKLHTHILKDVDLADLETRLNALEQARRG